MNSLEMLNVKNKFKIASHPVTQELWQDIMGDNPSNFKGGGSSQYTQEFPEEWEETYDYLVCVEVVEEEIHREDLQNNPSWYEGVDYFIHPVIWKELYENHTRSVCSDPGVFTCS